MKKKKGIGKGKKVFFFPKKEKDKFFSPPRETLNFFFKRKRKRKPLNLKKSFFPLLFAPFRPPPEVFFFF